MNMWRWPHTYEFTKVGTYVGLSKVLCPNCSYFRKKKTIRHQSFTRLVADVEDKAASETTVAQMCHDIT